MPHCDTGTAASLHGAYTASLASVVPAQSHTESLVARGRRGATLPRRGHGDPQTAPHPYPVPGGVPAQGDPPADGGSIECHTASFTPKSRSGSGDTLASREPEPAACAEAPRSLWGNNNNNKKVHNMIIVYNYGSYSRIILHNTWKFKTYLLINRMIH